MLQHANPWVISRGRHASMGHPSPPYYTITVVLSDKLLVLSLPNAERAYHIAGALSSFLKNHRGATFRESPLRAVQRASKCLQAATIPCNPIRVAACNLPHATCGTTRVCCRLCTLSLRLNPWIPKCACPVLRSSFRLAGTWITPTRPAPAPVLR